MEYIDQDGLYWDSYAQYIALGLCGLCGCGDDTIKDDLIQRITHHEEIKQDDPDYWFSDKYNELLLHILNNARIMEHGSTVCGCWLTPFGKEVKQRIIEERKR